MVWRSHIVNMMEELKKSKASAERLKREHSALESELQGVATHRDKAAQELAATEKVCLCVCRAPARVCVTTTSLIAQRKLQVA